eukprot:CAMPEP_0198592674 /NCGR_PEP_ID=MMETSP1462-20131121/138429_1 /TAXON_ID=1333877 /ORGANISM="Brandtodinium nutriculum, Strain RCC3387" /LENGTH=71 /DNA_ID=CAMNT_0044324255 /DNA_START=153 /DNA_END=364 /DNA_ORIENTATION=+
MQSPTKALRELEACTSDGSWTWDLPGGERFTSNLLPRAFAAAEALLGMQEGCFAEHHSEHLLWLLDSVKRS